MKFLVKGKSKIDGEITLAGAKNAVNKLLIASILSDEQSVLYNVPLIDELNIVFDLCKQIGSDINLIDHTVFIKTKEIKNFQVVSLSRSNRIPVLTIGPLVHRFGEAIVPVVGGDKIGPRPVDLHFNALTALGVQIKVENNCYYAQAKNGLHGAHINFQFPSVGATENTLMAAVLAKGKTIIENGAVEPEVIELVKFLQNMGAIIELGADRKFYIEGVKKLHGAKFNILPDRNEAVSFACLAIANNGNILIKNAIQDHLISFLSAVRKIGAHFSIESDGIRFWGDKHLAGINIRTDTHPGFMTDWQQPFAVVLTQSTGQSIIHETIYENRFNYTQDLNRMGAHIEVFKDCLDEMKCRFYNKGFNHSAVIYGPTQLHGTEIFVPDLRAGIAHIIAATVAEGESIINNAEEIDRGYENIDKKLKSIGVNIVRTN
ncbi:MAG: UDP-N-acetylglucosamine 1-carboxyvinyltransferase [Minisyncoccia bacterium]